MLCNKAIELNIETAGEAIKKFTASGNGKNNGEPKNFFGYPAAKLSTAPISKHLIFEDDNLYINLNSATDAVVLGKLKEVLIKNSGDKKVFFRLLSGPGAKTNLVETDFKVNYNELLIKAINNILK